MRAFSLLLVVPILAAFVTVPQPAAAAADQVPHFNIDKNCAFEASSGAVIQGTAQQTKEACRHDETTAKDELGKEWSKFTAAAKRSCFTVSSMGSEQSYVELQSCLEMSSNWKAEAQTTGQAGSNTRRH
jgi:hypothetical protein